MEKQIFVIHFSNSIKEIEEVEINNISTEFISKFKNVASYAVMCIDINPYDTLFIGEKVIAEELVVLGRHLGLNTSFRNTTLDELFSGKIDISNIPWEAKRELIDYYIRNTTVDNILDKLIAGGVLNEYDYRILQAE